MVSGFTARILHSKVSPRLKGLASIDMVSLALGKTLVATLSVFFTALSGTDISATLKHNGKSEAELTFVSSLSYDDFKSKVDTKISEYNIASGYSDAITVKSVSAIEEGYNVKVALRRADKVKIQGGFQYSSWSDFSVEGSEARKLVENGAKGNISTTVQAYYNGKLASLSVSRSDRVDVKPYTVNGESVETEAFLNEAASSGSKDKMLFFRVFDVSAVSKVSLSLPGSIRYVGGTGVKATSSSEVEITPVNVPVTITKTVTYEVDGVEKTKTEVEKKADALGFVGYFVYSQSLSPFAITMICIGSVMGVGLIAAFLFYIFHLGKKEQAKIKEGR